MDAADVRAALACSRASCPCQKLHGPNTHCLLHTDSDPSLTVHDKPGGGILVDCKAGCDKRDVIAALKGRELWPALERTPLSLVPVAPPPPGTTATATYEYRDTSGHITAIKGRFDSGDGRKSFSWKLPGVRGWPSGESGVVVAEQPLYGADLVASANPDTPVFFVEGEKTAHACRDRGLLAVCSGGGASTTPGAEALRVLAGRSVLLWPDNDKAGRAYMARVEAGLRQITASVRIVQVPYTEEHDDAVEYFGRGGTAESVFGLAPVTTTSVDWLSDDAVTIRLPSAVGTITFAFSEIEYVSKSLEVDLAVSLTGPGLEGGTVTQRINVLSGSAVADFRRLLDGTFEQGKNFWMSPFNKAVAALRRAIATHDPSILVGDIDEPGDLEYLVHGLIPAEEPVLIFGKGSAAKGWLALRMALGMTVSGEFLGRSCKRIGVLYIDYEDHKQTFRRRASRLLRGMGHDPAILRSAPLHYWPAKGVPLAGLVQGLKEKILQDHIELLVIDSVVAACGGKPEEAETAARYFNALAKIGVGSISIAHLAKNGDGTTPFGSIFFENFPRRTLLITRAGEGTDFTIAVIPKKVNDDVIPPSIGMRLTFDNPNGPVYTKYADVQSEGLFREKFGLREQIEGLLGHGALSTIEIAKELDISEAQAKNVLYANKSVFINLQPGRGNGAVARWGLFGGADAM